MRTAQAASDVQLKIASRPALAGKNSDETHSARSIPSVRQSERAMRAAPSSVVHASWSTANGQALGSSRSYCSRVAGYLKRDIVHSPFADSSASSAGANDIEPGVPP